MSIAQRVSISWFGKTGMQQRQTNYFKNYGLKQI